MAAQVWETSARMRVSSCAPQEQWSRIASGNQIASACAKFSSLRLPSTSHACLQSDHLRPRIFRCGKVVPRVGNKISSRKCVVFDDMMDTKTRISGMRGCCDGNAAEDNAVVNEIALGSRDNSMSCGFGDAFLCTSLRCRFLLVFGIVGYDQDILRSLASLQILQTLPSGGRSVDRLFQLTRGTMACVCLSYGKNSSPESLAPPQAGPSTFVCFFLEIFAIPVALAIFSSFVVIPVLIGAICALFASLFTLLPGFFWLCRVVWEFAFKKTSVVKFQVGLMGRIDNLEVEIKQLLNVFEGPQQVLTDSVVALLRHSDSYIAADYTLYTHSNTESIEEKFMYYSLEERGMRDESLEFSASGSGYSSRSQSVSEDYRLSHLVVTLVVVVNGIRKLPEMKDTKDIEENLKRLGCIQADALQDVGVYCTPFSDQFKMAIKYPKLRYY